MSLDPNSMRTQALFAALFAKSSYCIVNKCFLLMINEIVVHLTERNAQHQAHHTLCIIPDDSNKCSSINVCIWRLETFLLGSYFVRS